MILQISFVLFYRIVLETSGANDRQIVELHWRDFAVFVSLSSRTNTRQGLRLCFSIRREAALRTSKLPILFRKSVWGL
jgi:hypothetical protein